MKNKLFSLEEVLEQFHDGQSIMFANLHGMLTAKEIISGLVEKNVKGLTTITTCCGQSDASLGRLIANHQVKKCITTHLGMNPDGIAQMSSGELEVEFVPQGTFAERIRAGGYGLGGILTPTGVGTIAAEGKQVITVNGKDYLLELPIRADIALLHANKADKAGNLHFRRLNRHAQDYMAMAADLVIVEADELVEIGELDPDDIHVPAPIVDMVYVRQGEKRPLPDTWKLELARLRSEGGM